MPYPQYTVEVTVCQHEDGCVILSAAVWSNEREATCYERYSPGTAASRVIRVLSAWLERVELDEPDSELLWEELQLPFDTLPGGDV